MRARVQLEYLRRYRDEVLSRSKIGRVILPSYRLLSAQFTPVVERSELFRRLARLLIFEPAAAWATLSLNQRAYRDYAGNYRAKLAVRRILRKRKQSRQK